MTTTGINSTIIIMAIHLAYPHHQAAAQAQVHQAVAQVNQTNQLVVVDVATEIQIETT